MTSEVTLAQCPIGLFWAGDELCLKTEYGNNEGRIDAYIVSTGEFFWGSHPQTIPNQRMQMVRPVPEEALTRLTAQSGEGRSGAGEDAVEAVAQWLHDEGGFGDSFSGRTWPEHPDDTGQREGGWVKLVPSDVQAKFRDVGRR